MENKVEGERKGKRSMREKLNASHVSEEKQRSKSGKEELLCRREKIKVT